MNNQPLIYKKIPRKLKKKIRRVMAKKYPSMKYKIDGVELDKTGFLIQWLNDPTDNSPS